MTPRTFWDRNGSLWELSPSGWQCWLVWHFELGEDFVLPGMPSEYYGTGLVDVVRFGYAPLVAAS